MRGPEVFPFSSLAYLLNLELFQPCWLAGEFPRPTGLFLPVLGLQETWAELGFTRGSGL